MSLRILPVEDEPGLVLIVSGLLRAGGYEVEVAGNGPAALSRALASRFDLLIMLPGKSGFEVCKELRVRGVTPRF